MQTTTTTTVDTEATTTTTVSHSPPEGARLPDIACIWLLWCAAKLLSLRGSFLELMLLLSGYQFGSVFLVSDDAKAKLLSCCADNNNGRKLKDITSSISTVQVLQVRALMHLLLLDFCGIGCPCWF